MSDISVGYNQQGLVVITICDDTSNTLIRLKRIDAEFLADAVMSLCESLEAEEDPVSDVSANGDEKAS